MENFVRISQAGRSGILRHAFNRKRARMCLLRKTCVPASSVFFLRAWFWGLFPQRPTAPPGKLPALRGRVLPIGGLKEKLLAAKNAGVRTVCVPKKNEKDVEEISGEIKKGLEIVYVETMEQVLRVAFCEKKE